MCGKKIFKIKRENITLEMDGSSVLLFYRSYDSDIWSVIHPSYDQKGVCILGALALAK